MSRSWEFRLGILLQGKLPRSVDQPPQPASSCHEAQGQRGERHTHTCTHTPSRISSGHSHVGMGRGRSLTGWGIMNLGNHFDFRVSYQAAGVGMGSVLAAGRVSEGAV